MMNNRKKIEVYKDFSILQELNYKNEGTIYSIIQGDIDPKLINSINIKYSYFETIEEARTFIDNLKEEEKWFN